MKWYNVELNLNEAEYFHQELMERNIKHEMSAAYNLIHFEILATPKQADEINAWIDEQL